MKDLILRELIENKNAFISGEDISKKYQVTRAAVWKYIKKLKEEGYQIESVTNKGYRLLSEPDKLERVYLDFDKDWILGKEFIYLEEVDSTNIYAKKIALLKPEGTIVLAEKQNKGKGRRGRNWDSSYGTGIWMSLILKPNIITSDAVMLTQVAAAAVVTALNEQLDCNAKIKWPNDIVVGNKKVCGILTELSGEIESLNYIVLGIGINVNQNLESFPDDIKEKAISLKACLGRHLSRKQILLSVLKYLNIFYNQFIKDNSLENIIDICKKESATLSKEIRIIKDDDDMEGKAIDLTNRGGLLVEDRQGQIIEIISGEVSVRGLYNYID